MNMLFSSLRFQQLALLLLLVCDSTTFLTQVSAGESGGGGGGGAGAGAGGCGLAIGLMDGIPGSNGNGGVSAEKRKVDLSNLPSSCDGEADTLTVTLPNGNSKSFQKTASIVKPGKAHWHGEAATDGSSLEYIRSSSNGVVFGSLVDLTDGTVSQFGADANGQPVVTITPTSDFPDESDPFDTRRMLGTTSTNDSEEITSLFSSSSKLLRGTTSTKKNDNNNVDDVDEQQHRQLQTLTTIDVLAVWTAKSECRNSGLSAGCTRTATTEANMRSRINLAIAETNTAYELSGVNAELRLVHAYLDASYVEASSNAFNAALSELQSTTDGIMDDVHAIRTAYGADVVAMIIDDPQYCGIAYLGPRTDLMFSVTAWNCATGYYSFGHEIGHNFGCYHDRGTQNACTSSDYRYGYRDPQARFRSILAYNCRTGQCDQNAGTSCTRIQRFSNPTLGYNGNPIGDVNNDNAKRINSVRATVAAYYTPPAPGCTSDAECDDGLFCNGAEVCNAGTCEAGAPPVCDDGLFCNGVETCNEATDSCVSGTPPVCNDGLFCNGVETCNESTKSCMAGTPPVCDDGLFCNGVETCDEATDSCVSGTAPTCTSSNLCDGPGTCNESLDRCDYNSPVVCTSTSTCGRLEGCNQNTGICEQVGTGEDGVCRPDLGETCSACPGDCTATFGGIVCGNGVCEPGEDCNTCPSDCNGITSGPRSGRFCCMGALQPNLCGDDRCNADGFTCGGGVTEQTSCCGDGVCQPETEDFMNCPFDCAPPSPTASPVPSSAPTSSPGTGGCPVCAATGSECCGTCIDGGKPSNRGCF